MPLKEARCKNCNAPLVLNTSIKQANCLHCGTPYFMEDIINNIYLNISQQYRGGGDPSAELTVEMRMKLNAAKASLKLGKYEDALIRFRTLSEEIPQDYRVWWGQIRAITEEFTRELDNRAVLKELDSLFDSMMIFIPQNNRGENERIYQDYCQQQARKLSRRREELISRAERLQEEHDELQEQMRECQQAVYWSADQIRQAREIVMGIILLVGFISFSVPLFAMAAIGCVLYLGVVEPLLIQWAEEQESTVETAIAEFSARSRSIEQELHQIETQIAQMEVE